MPKTLNFTAALSIAAAVLAGILFHFFERDIYLTLAITFGTVSYHLVVRLLVGLLFNITMNNRADYNRWWFRPRRWEAGLYRRLNVKAWKNKMPTYVPELFSKEKHTWDEIAQAMCQSELVHETCAVLSFVPLIASKYFGSFYVFLITSICGALFDLMFVVIQRYNRPWATGLAQREK